MSKREVEDLHLAQWPIKNMILQYSHILQELKELKNLGSVTGDLAEVLPCRRRAENSYVISHLPEWFNLYPWLGLIKEYSSFTANEAAGVATGIRKKVESRNL